METELRYPEIQYVVFPGGCARLAIALKSNRSAREKVWEAIHTNIPSSCLADTAEGLEVVNDFEFLLAVDVVIFFRHDPVGVQVDQLTLNGLSLKVKTLLIKLVRHLNGIPEDPDQSCLA